MVRKDISGKRYGRLVAIEPVGKNKKGLTLWRCKCDCGNEKITTVTMLNAGKTSSCGCYQHERRVINATKHGKRNTRQYTIWFHMKERCYNPKCREYRFYGARGVEMCKEWLNDFKSFYDWSLKNGYQDNLTIDRIDFYGNYEPNNCRWITIQEQQCNRRNNRFFEYNGKRQTISQWAKEYGFTWEQLRDRIDKLGWSFEKAIITPIHSKT